MKLKCLYFQYVVAILLSGCSDATSAGAACLSLPTSPSCPLNTGIILPQQLLSHNTQRSVLGISNSKHVGSSRKRGVAVLHGMASWQTPYIHICYRRCHSSKNRHGHKDARNCKTVKWNFNAARLAYETAVDIVRRD